MFFPGQDRRYVFLVSNNNDWKGKQVQSPATPPRTPLQANTIWIYQIKNQTDHNLDALNDS